MRGRLLPTSRLAALGIVCLAATGAGRAATYQVGPGKPYASLQAVAGLLDPGDLVEVDGNATYPGGVAFTRPRTAAEKITVRDVVVHDCPAHGILGADQGSGSLALERVEVYRCGNGTSQHQIYVATDEVHHPGSVFRMEHC